MLINGVSPHLRVARATNDIDALIAFYTAGLGFKILGRFHDHNGFDGIMIGGASAPYHFEFTCKPGHCAGRAPNQESLLVFYLPDAAEWRKALDRMRDAGYSPVPPFNPYWETAGSTFEDNDGYRIVLQRDAWLG